MASPCAGTSTSIRYRQTDDMLRRIATGMLWATIGYLLGAIGGGGLVYMLSANQFDRAMEAEMTGAFVLGPIAAVIAFVVGAWRASRRSPAS